MFIIQTSGARAKINAMETITKTPSLDTDVVNLVFIKLFHSRPINEDLAQDAGNDQQNDR